METVSRLVIMHHHSHDNIDWDTRLRQLRDEDSLTATQTRRVAETLVSGRESCRSVIDVGSGAGGASAAFAEALPGGTVTLVDSAPELLAAAERHTAAHASPGVEVHSVRADAADEELGARVGQADLVFCSLVVHHLPDQLAGLRRLVELVRPGGRLVVVESGLWAHVLPWDVGVGEPGLEERLLAARHSWFRRMRAEMPGTVRLPVGWSTALRQAGLDDVESWSYLVDWPAPVTGPVRDIVLRRLEWLREAAVEECSADDLAALDQLLDEHGPHYAGRRDDLYYLAAHSVFVGSKPM
ncbi:Trans-aconitate methyltransferase [Actinopolyspora xinjiangensis]|uniref:Trans-aconitate methyltransferase n=2 Tax=Actinopolyspora xinjiangensis TaxID=405564 RepID=A0A1H0W057_9ACTN|nr:Trans-aconitate methyltransferase [Actinopolyspora xinjiangensis]